MINPEKQPERCSAFERGMVHNNLIAQEFGFKTWLVDYALTKESPLFCGRHWLTTTPTESAFMEGFFAAVAFCSGAASRGKVMDISAKTFGHDQLHMMLNTAKSAMEHQTLWEQNKDSKP